ncbi:MAG: hypothetical protein NVSMB70_06610 [Chamaesiphon sp.]
MNGSRYVASTHPITPIPEITIRWKPSHDVNGNPTVHVLNIMYVIVQ